jgi:hypothetical protein
MSVSVQSLYIDACRELGQGQGNSKLAASFVTAVNRTLDTLSVKSDKATKFPHISSINDSVSISVNYEYILYAGVIYFLIRMGHRPSDPNIAKVVYGDSANVWEEAIADYIQDVDNIFQSTDSNDVIGLGYPDSDT